MDNNGKYDAQTGISAIIVNYNAGGRLESLVSSLISIKHVSRVVVVDNASTDLSLEKLETNYRNNARFVLIRNKVNRGFSAANNQGIALAQSDRILFINPDCEINVSALDRFSELFNARPDVGMLGVLIRNMDGSEQRGCRRYLPDPRRSLMRVLGINRHWFTGQITGFDLAGTPLPDRPVEVEAISGAFMLIRRDALLQVGLWDEGYFLHCEDLDICMRLGRAGWKILFVPDVSITHHQGWSGRGRPLFVLWHKHRGMWRFYSKFYRKDASWFVTILIWGSIWTRFSLLTAFVLLRRPFER